jgi:acyl carrier protein
MTYESLIEVIAKSIFVDGSSLSMDSSAETVEEWDSLGHISILSALDEATDGKSADIVELTQATSVREINDLLKENGLLS